jgi:hypothetical protein
VKKLAAVFGKADCCYEPTWKRSTKSYHNANASSLSLTKSA